MSASQEAAEAQPAHVGPPATEHSSDTDPSPGTLSDDDATAFRRVVVPLSGGGTIAAGALGTAGIAILQPLSFSATQRGVEGAAGQRAFLEAMSCGNRLITYDQRGAGESSDGGAPVTWQQSAADLWDVADALGIERAVLYGVFDAGHTAVRAAALRPERTLALILNAVPVRLPVVSPPGNGGATDVVAQSRQIMHSIGIGEHDTEVVLADATRSRALASPGASDLAPLLGQVACRALVIEPQRRTFCRGWGAALAGAMPAARAVTPAGAAQTVGVVNAFLGMLSADLGTLASQVSPTLSAAIDSSERSVGEIHRILVVVGDDASSGHAIGLACRLGAAQGAEILLVHAIEVPFTLPVDQPPPAALQRADEALKFGEAIVARHQLRSRTRIIVGRSAPASIVRAAEEEGVHLIVMAGQPEAAEGADHLNRQIQEVLRRAPGRVLVDQGITV